MSDQGKEFWSTYDHQQRIEAFNRWLNWDFAHTRDMFGCTQEELDQIAHEVGYVGIYKTVVDEAGMRDTDPAITPPQFADRYQPRKLCPPLNNLQHTQKMCNEFAKRHIYECSKELIEWQDTSILKHDGKVRELATMCKEFAPNNGLSVAESIVRGIALRALVKHIDYHNAT